MEIVTAEELVFSTSARHRLGRASVESDFVLPSGRRLAFDQLQGTLNRLAIVPENHLSRAGPSDRIYAVQELHALFTSVLYGLPGRVLNRAGPRGLCGPWLSPAEWMAQAGRAGLPIEPYLVRGGAPIPDLVLPAERVVYVVGDAVVIVPSHPGEPPAAIAEGCRALALGCGVELLGVDFAALSHGPWTFVGASPMPDLRPGGEALLDALLAAMVG